MSFFQKLCWLTNNAFPDSVLDRYRELMRASQQWRDLMNWKRFGFGHDTEPGINIPINWQDKCESWLVMQRYVVDGNFTAQHMNMKQPHLDVILSDGLGYMVIEADYKAHLSSAQESKEIMYTKGPLAAITVQSMQQTQIEVIFEQLEWLLLLVHVMVALFLTLW
ncbi:hypothetical protein F4604DRAFT_1692197 [Suillus subluteus]|nr:hypothetical protein F4604DRAFT_1692197 [Suillus subluteus]